MPYTSFCCDVEASVDTLWRLLEDKIENPDRYLPEVEEIEILDRGPDGILRRMRTSAFEVTERITVDRPHLEITYSLIDHPDFAGEVIDKITPAREDEPEGHPLLTLTLDWRRHGGAAAAEEDLLELITASVLVTKELAEEADRRPKGKKHT